MGNVDRQHTPITWEWLKFAIPLLVVLATIITFASGLQSQVNYLDARLCIVEEERRNTTMWTQSIEVRLAEIQRDIAYIRIELDKR